MENSRQRRAPVQRVCLLSQIEGIDKLRSISTTPSLISGIEYLSWLNLKTRHIILAKRGDEKKEFMRLINLRSPLF
jgi:hypothetical protein